MSPVSACVRVLAGPAALRRFSRASNPSSAARCAPNRVAAGRNTPKIPYKYPDNQLICSLPLNFHLNFQDRIIIVGRLFEERGKA